MIITISFPYGRMNNPRKKYQMDIGRGPFDTYGELCHTMYDKCNYLPYFKVSDKQIGGWLLGEITSDHIFLHTNANLQQSAYSVIQGGVNRHSLAGLGFIPTRDRVWFNLPFHSKFVKALYCIKNHKTRLRQYPASIYLCKTINQNVNNFQENEQITEEYLDGIISTYEAAEVMNNVPQKTGV